LFSAHAPVKLLRGGVGLSVYQDKLGQIKDFGFKLAYAYRLNLGIGELGIGLAAGMVSKTVGSSWNAIDNYMLDPSINNNNISKGKFDLDLGLYYKTDKIYLGLSTTHLPQSTFSQAGGAGVNTFDFDFKVVRHYYVMAGYNHQLQSIPLTLQPSVFVKSDASSTIIDINIIALYNNMFWGGVSYRATDAIVPMFGIQKDIVPGTVKFGYSYDVTTSMLKKYNSGTHEIMLGYCFNLPDNSKVQKHKTVRFL
jgi:type IX secretion system PorP/SprF family membrane protein